VRWRKLHVARAGCLTAIEQTSFYHAQKLQEKARMVLESLSQFSLPTIADERPFEGAIVLTRDCDTTGKRAHGRRGDVVLRTSVRKDANAEAIALAGLAVAMMGNANSNPVRAPRRSGHTYSL